MGIMKKFFEKIKYNDVFFKFQKYFCNFSDFTIILLEAWNNDFPHSRWIVVTQNIVYFNFFFKIIFFATKHV
jgi:hypothetical protein